MGDMKFILTLYVCSFFDGTCTLGFQYPTKFDTWKECVYAAHIESTKLIQSMDQDLVDNKLLATKYACTQISET